MERNLAEFSLHVFDSESIVLKGSRVNFGVLYWESAECRVFVGLVNECCGMKVKT